MTIFNDCAMSAIRRGLFFGFSLRLIFFASKAGFVIIVMLLASGEASVLVVLLLCRYDLTIKTPPNRWLWLIEQSSCDRVVIKINK